MKHFQWDSHKEGFKAAFPHTLPVLTGYLVLGMAYGVLMQVNGYGALWAVLMSAVAFCGSMQYVAISLLTTAFNPLQAFLMSLTVNARHLFYGLSMLEKYQGLGKTRFFLIFALTDETFSISSSLQPPDHVDRKSFYFWLSFLDYSYWVLGTLLGSLLGNVLHFNTTGLDFVLTALFVVLFIEQIKTKGNLPPGIIGLLCASVALFFFGPGAMVIPAMALILLVLLIWRKMPCS